MAEGREHASLEEAIEAGVDALSVALNTALPGVIVSFDATTNEATIRLEILRLKRDIDDNRQGDAYPELTDVPVLFPRAGGFSLTFPVEQGDECLVLFAQRDISAWTASGGSQLPPTLRRHNISDAVALMGLTSSPNRLTDWSASDLEIRNDAGTQRVTLKVNGDIEIEAGKIAIGDGSEDVLKIISDLATDLQAITVEHSGSRPLSAGSIAAFAAIKSRIDQLIP